jgi:hypothetical protein
MEIRSVASSPGFELASIVGSALEGGKGATPEFIIALRHPLRIPAEFHVQIWIHLERFRNIFIAFHFFLLTTTVLHLKRAKISTGQINFLTF